jgi:hypothetical protein
MPSNDAFAQWKTSSTLKFDSPSKLCANQLFAGLNAIAQFPSSKTIETKIQSALLGFTLSWLRSATAAAGGDEWG